MTADSWEARMAARAQARGAATPPCPHGHGLRRPICMECLAESGWSPGPCMTGDGNPSVKPAALCQECLDRPYGTAGDIHGVDVCGRCWIDRYVWTGNSWGIVHRGSSFSRVSGCECDCHEDEIWLASAATSSAGSTP